MTPNTRRPALERSDEQTTSRKRETETETKLKTHQQVFGMTGRSRKDNRGDNEATRGRKRRNRGGRTTSLNPKTKTENSSNVQDATRHRIHVDFSNVQNAIWGSYIQQNSTEHQTKVRQK